MFLRTSVADVLLLHYTPVSNHTHPVSTHLQATRPARELAVLQQRLDAAEAEAQGLRGALQEAQERHSQQLAK
jgi:hypothetical protein